MKQFIKLLVIFICIAYIPIFSQNSEIIEVFNGKDSLEVYNDEIAVRLKTGKDVTNLLDFSKDIKEIGKISKHRFGIIKLKPNSKLFDNIESLKKSGYFEIVEPNLVRRAQIVPNDEHYALGDQYAIDKIRLPEAWDVTTGGNQITIGVLDSGLPIENNSLSHPDLNDPNRYLLGVDEVNDGNGVKDELGHGTLVSGIIGAKTNNTTGIAGVNWNSKIKMYQVFTGDNRGDPQYFANGVQDAVDDGVKVINYSGGGINYSEIEETAIQYARDNQVLVVCSAGNAYLGPVKYPAALSPQYDNLIAVSATDNNDDIASFSSIGNEVTIAAPGNQIFSTTPNYSSFYFHNNSPYLSPNYDYNDGTSFSAPYVTGVASLMYSVNPNLTVAQVKTILEKTALDKGEYGKDNYFGYGRLNAFRAVKAAQILASYPGATFITAFKSSTPSLDQNWYNLVINNQVYTARRYKMDVTFNTSDYFSDPSNALIWYNSNGWSNSNPLYNPPPWYQIISQNGFSVTVRTYTYELIDMWGYHFWSTPLSELKIDVLGYGTPHIPLSVSISGPSTAPCATGTWSANVSGGYPPYTYQWYQMYASGGGLESSLQKGTIAIQPYKQIDTWYPVGNNTSTLNYYLCGGNSYIRVDVKDSHNTLKSVQQYVAGANGGGALEKTVANNETAISKVDLEIPKENNLIQNYPNPFNPSTIISYSIKTEGRVSLKIYNTLGEEVATLVDEIKPAGSYEAEFNASELPSGIYIYKIQSAEYLSTKKMLLIK